MRLPHRPLHPNPTTQAVGTGPLADHDNAAGALQATGLQQWRAELLQGLLRFAGPYDNPALDILALRPNLSQRVGVRVTGTALAPQVRLYAEPEMPDADKLA